MSSTLQAFLRSSCRGLGHEPRFLDSSDAAEDPLTAVLQEAIALRQEQRADLSLQLLEIARNAGLSSDWIEDNRARALLALGRVEEARLLLTTLCGSATEAIAAAARSQLAELSGHQQPAGDLDKAVLTALLEQAISLRELGQARASLHLLEQAAAAGHESPWLQDNRARALVALGQRLEASAIWESLATHPDASVAAMASVLAGQLRGALIEELLLAVGRAAGSHSWAPRFLAAELPSLQAVQDALLEEAIAIRENGLPDLSLALLDTALELGFSSPWLQDNRARAFVALGRRGSALALWQELASGGDAAMSAIAEPLAAEQERLLLAELPQQLSRHAAEHGISLEWVWRGADTPAALEDAILKDAIAARERGQAAASLALLEAAVDAGLPNGWLQDNRARALVHLERIVDAVAVWRDLQARDDAVLAQETAEMLSLYGRQADRQATMDRADELLSANRVEEAIRVLSDAILADPEWDGWRHGLKRAVALQQSDGQAGDSLLQRELHDPQLALKAFDAFLRAVEQRQPNPAD
jgi:hypothetical protein